MTLALYTTARSANGRKPLAVARQLGLDVEVHTVDVYRGEGQSAEYKELNPFGKIPTLVDGDGHSDGDGGMVLWESNAVIVYLAEAHGGYALSSTDPKVRAGILRWLFWEAAHWQPVLAHALAPRVGHILFARGSGAPEPTVDWWAAAVSGALGHVESYVRRTAFLCGDEVTLADFSVAGMTTYFAAAGFPEERYPGLAGWLRRMEGLPGWASTWVEPWTAVARGG
ncbi:MAG: glutathione S-transferase family protein [Polyangiaceae bacterium]